MTEPISKEELRAIIETQSKATEQMVLVAKSLSDILVEQRKITDKLENGLIRDLRDTIVEQTTFCTTAVCEKLVENQRNIDPFIQDCKLKVSVDIPEMRTTLNGMKDDIKFSKWFITAVGLVIVAATVVLRVMDSRQIDTANIKAIVAAIHSTETEKKAQTP